MACAQDPADKNRTHLNIPTFPGCSPLFDVAEIAAERESRFAVSTVSVRRSEERQRLREA